MPHLILEYSSNVLEKNEFSGLFDKCHRLLEEQLPTEIANCKSRAIAQTDYYVGNGQEKNAFVHVWLKIMPGRKEEVLKTTTHNLMLLLKDHFATSLKTLNLQITLELTELNNYYLKSTNQN